MIIGIVTTWFERGAAYVSKNYKELLEEAGHIVYIFARGGESENSLYSEKWNENYVTRSSKFLDSTIEKRKFSDWIKKRKIETVLFNEQRDFEILVWMKKKFPEVKTGAYVDFYTENMLPWFLLYDFLICNTKRHMQAMKHHPQKFYIRWGTDINLFHPTDHTHEVLTFFHSAGMSTRKGTDILVEAFIKGELYKNSKLLIHTQIPVEKLCSYKKKELEEYGIEVIQKTVTAPGLYYMGDVYVYPARLDGLGLTMYEALASGMPMITSDFPPMNEVGMEEFVKRVKIANHYCRWDAYYFPMVECNISELIEAMKWYISHPQSLESQKNKARAYAEDFYDLHKQRDDVSKIFVDSKIRPLDLKLVSKLKKNKTKNNPFVSYWYNWRFVHDMVKRGKGN